MLNEKIELRLQPRDAEHQLGRQPRLARLQPGRDDQLGTVLDGHVELHDLGTKVMIPTVGPVRENVVIVSVETEIDIAELVRELVASGAGVIDVRRHTADLESIFRGAA